MSASTATVVVPWHRDEERDSFLREWKIKPDNIPEWLILQHDERREGCGATKNRGISKAMVRGADIVVVLDGDCYPGPETASESNPLEHHVARHVSALSPQPVRMFEVVTRPPSRGTPYSQLDITMPVAMSIGMWTDIGDYCAVRQLAHNAVPMQLLPQMIFGRYFALCGMNIAFRPAVWREWAQFIEVSRFDDIWMGWLLQREAYRRGYCFNLNGPLVRHSRQSNVWANLHDEAIYLQASESLWARIATHPSDDYETLRGLLPVR
jgi:hypothetical protein